MRGKMYFMYFGILCLVASTLALPTISGPSQSSNEIKEKREEYLNNVEVVKVESLYPGPGLVLGSYEKNTDTEDWKKEQEINEYNNDHNQVSKEVEEENVNDEEVEKEEAEVGETEDEYAYDEDEGIQSHVEDDEEDRDEENNDKYSKFEKSVIIKWKVPTSFLLNSMIANMSPVLRAPSPYVYQKYRFPIQNVPYSGYANYHL